MISNYSEGSNITLLDTYYQYPKKRDDGKYDRDYLTIIYKDNDTGKKSHQIIEEPDYQFFTMKDDNKVLNYNKLFEKKENLDLNSVSYNKLLSHIAKISNNEEFYYDNIKNGNARENRRLHSLYNIFNSDMDINDHYRFRFDKMYVNNITKISKAYFDIEVDVSTMAGDFPELGECEVNAVSYIFNNKITVFVLRNSSNPLIEQFERSLNKKLYKELNDFIINHAGGKEVAEKYGLDNLEYEFMFFDEEIVLIYELFKTINIDEPDFLLAWNMSFDVPYLYERIIALGYDPKDIMCHPAFPKDKRIAKYYIDQLHKDDFAERGDRYVVSSHTVYLDQLVHFASRRKGQSAFPNFKLDTAGEIITGIRKLDYSHITHDIGELPYKDFKVFIFYNIMDTIVQKCIEEKVKDIDYVFNKALINNTRYEKVHRQTVYLTNRATKKFDSLGYVIGNNKNYNTPKERFEGALVGDPTHNSDVAKIKIENQIINIVENLDDFDFKSLYPSIARENNMAPNTQIGKVIIDEPVHKYENPSNNEFYDRGGDYIEDLCSQNIIVFANRWMSYPSYREWLDDLDEYMSRVETVPTNAPLTYGKIMNPKPSLMKILLPKPINGVKLLQHYPKEFQHELYLNKIR